MKKKSTQFRWLVTMFLLVAAMVMPSVAWAWTQPEGEGTEANPYQIRTADELYWFAGHVNVGNTTACAELTDDIDVNGEWTPIGSCGPYKGTFDGQGHTIIGLSFSSDESDSDPIGFFRGTETNSVIRNVGIVNSSFNGWQEVGGVCGSNFGTIENCYFTGTVSGNYYVGGVCGSNYGTIKNCYNNGSVSYCSKGAMDMYGGVCGENSGTIENCYNTGTVSGSDVVGGVCGANSGTINNCYNTGTVSGNSSVGGVCNSNNGTITGCYNTGAVSSNGNSVGGVCVDNYRTITNCYYLSGTATGGIGSTDVTGSAEAKTATQFESGEVCYLLNGSRSEGTEDNPLAWYQNIDKEGAVKDAYPVLDNTHGVAYQGTVCTGYYSNTKDATGTHLYPAEYDNGFKICSHCGDRVYQPAKLNANSQYEIGNAGQLYWFAAMVNGTLAGVTQNLSANAILTADITVNTGVLKNDGTLNNNSSGFEPWTPIGNGSTLYTGTFDGQGHTISGLYFNNDHLDVVGFFGRNSGTIKNVGVVDSYFCGNDYVGGVCGENGNTITGCYNIGTVSGCSNVGGVCGYNSSTITGCYYNSEKFTGNAIGTNNGTATKVEGKTTEQFKSGEVAYLLSQGTEGSVWGQQLGTDDYPVLSDYKVIKAAKGDKDANNNDTYWATFSNLNSDVTLSVPSARNLKVYNATVSGGTLTLSERTDSQVAKGEGVLLKTDKEYVNAKENETDNLTKADYTDNNLVATPATEETIDAQTGYTLYRLTYNNVSTKEGLGFYLGLVKDANGIVTSSDGSQLKATPGKAYLKVSTEASIKPTAAAPTRGFPFSGEGETTGFGEIVIEGDAGISGTANADGRIYNLQGQQISAPAKGLYIKNNKKVLIK